MADATLKIQLESQIRKAESAKEQILLKNKQAFSADQLTQIESFFTRLRNLLKNLDITSNKGLDVFNAAMNDLLEVLKKGAKTLSKTTEEYSKLERQISSLQEKQKNNQIKKDAITETLDEKSRHFYDEAVKSRVKEADIHYKVANRQAGNLSTLRSKVDEGADAFKTPQDFEKAKQLVEKLATEEKQMSTNLDTVNDILEEINKELTKKKDALLEEAKKQNPVAGDILKIGNQTEEVIGARKETNKQAEAQEKRKKQLETATAEMNKLTAATNKQSSSFGKAFKQFSIYVIALRTVKKALQDAVKTVKDLDKYLTEQAMVTGKTRKETYALLSAYQDMASDLGATTKEVAQVTTQFLRQGKSTADALTLTRAAVSAAKVAGISGAESVNYLTTALNGFQLAAEDAMKVSDKFAAIAATSATSYQEIATALSKVASQANIAGMSIDYTTALLAKGIETTREPAESIGTALKTIIARMRELTDYGKTLEDGMNINNVETQLAYVGIALRNANGELRSTEEVLDELGGKWETLSSNQQAAVAKALAGTRQQSRLIAMMTDYERVTELQQIAERSAGATAAQAAVYMEGMEAALNKVNVAWEKIVSSLTNSDTIIDLINFVSGFLDKLGDFLSTDFGLVATITTISVLTAGIIGMKAREYQLSKAQQQLNHQMAKDENTKNKLAQQKVIEEKKSLVLSLKQRLQTLKNNRAVADRIRLHAIEHKNKNLENLATQKILTYDKEINEIKTQSLPAAKRELQLENDKMDILDKQGVLLQSQDGLFQKMSVGLTGIVSILTLVVGLYKTMALGISTVIKLTKKEERAKMKAALADKIKAAWGMAGSASAIPVAGWVIAAAILTAILGISIAVAAVNYDKQQKSAEHAADSINQLSNEIYKLQEKANAIKTIERQYDALDKKIIQTTEDQKKMNELLDSAGDKLSSEDQKNWKGKDIEGTSEQDIYKNLQSNKAKQDYLANIEEEAIQKANVKRREQLDILKKLTPEQRKLLLTSKENADYLMAQDAIYAINNNTLYEYMDTLGDVGENVEALTQKILEQMDAEEAYSYASDTTGRKIRQLADVINNANTVIGDSQVSLAEVLDSTKYSFEDKIKAYNDLYAAIETSGDNTALEAFKDAYGQWAQLQEAMSSTSIQFMDRIGISIDKLNAFGQALNKLGMETEDAMSSINALFDAINDGADLSSSITSIFSNVLNRYAPDSKEYKAAYNSILKAYQDAAGTGLLNMGQNLKLLQSQINSLYETASKWSTMSKDEQTSFIQDNYELFQGEGGARLFEAFQTGNYKEIQAALAKNEVLKEQIGLRLEQLKIDLQIAEAATDRNEAEIAWLKEQIKELETYEDEMSSVYQADLKLRLEQEDKQLEMYKSYLEKQKDALTESLDKRKEAYEKYFNAINQEAEDQDYEQNAATLMANLSKLSSSTDAESRQQSKQLEQQLQQLEKERLETLRERAQEAVLNNLDNEVSQINDKFDKLLENQAALLDAMNKEIAADPNDFISRLTTSGIENMTATQAEDFIKNSLIPTYDSSISNDILDGIKVRQEGSSLFLTLNNQEIELSNNNQQELSTTILAALREMGISI